MMRTNHNCEFWPSNVIVINKPCVLTWYGRVHRPTMKNIFIRYHKIYYINFVSCVSYFLFSGNEWRMKSVHDFPSLSVDGTPWRKLEKRNVKSSLRRLTHRNALVRHNRVSVSRPFTLHEYLFVRSVSFLSKHPRLCKEYFQTLKKTNQAAILGQCQLSNCFV